MTGFQFEDVVHIHVHRGSQSKTVATIRTIRDAPPLPRAKQASQPVEIEDNMPVDGVDPPNADRHAQQGEIARPGRMGSPHHPAAVPNVAGPNFEMNRGNARLTDSAPRMRATAPGGVIPVGRSRDDRAGISASGPHRCSCGKCSPN